MNSRTTVALGVLLGVALTAATVAVVAQQQQAAPDPLSVPMSLCISAHPATDDYVSESGSGYVEQTAEQACDRWLRKVGTVTFIKQWTPEYAAAYRAAFAGTETDQ